MSDSKPLGNPYNPQDPIMKPEKFGGRKEELEEIDYLLNQATYKRPNYPNIAITGLEGAGKTSLSYMLEEKAQKKNILPIRIKLDEDKVQDEVFLFTLILGKIANKHVGVSEEPESYIEFLNNWIDEVEISLGFVKAHLSPNEKKNKEEKVTEKLITNDLEEIFKRTEKEAVAIILDNSQQLTNNPVLLQKLKNIFTEIPNYLLVFSGTNKTFEEISSAFSPLARAFDKIEIGPFEEFEDTKECIKNPLSEEEEDLISDNTIWEIHHITNGSPYEINLIMKQAYRFYEVGELDELSLSTEVIDKVSEKMEGWRKSIDSDFLNKIESLSEKQLKTLVSTIEIPDLQKEWLIKYNLLKNVDSETGRPNIDEDEIKQIIEDLVQKNLLLRENGRLSFAGDLYCLAYLKYYSLSKKLVGGFRSFSWSQTNPLLASIHQELVEGIILSNIDRYYDSHFDPDNEDEYKPSLKTIIESDESKLSKIRRQLEHELNGKSNAFLADKFVGDPVENDYYRYKHFWEGEEESHQEKKMFEFRVNIEWLNKGFIAVIHFENVDNISKTKKRIEGKIATLMDNLEKMGYEIILEDEHTFLDKGYEYLSDGKISEAINKFQDAIDINPNFIFALFWLSIAYEEKGDLEQGLEAINRAIALRNDFTDAYIRKGILLTKLGEQKKAENAFNRATDLDSNSEVYEMICCKLSDEEEYEKAIQYGKKSLDLNSENIHAMYHIAVAYRMLKKFKEAKSWCNEIIEKINEDNHYHFRVMTVKATILKENGELEEAKKTIKQGLKILNDLKKNYSQSNLLYNKACIEALLGNSKKSIENLKKSIQMDSSYRKEAREDDDFKNIRKNEEFQALIENNNNTD